MTDAIGVGDVVTDNRRQPQSLLVVDRDHRSAGEHPAVQMDAIDLAHGVTPEDAVFDCVFLPDSSDDRASAPKKTYALPESVLTRYPAEAAFDSGGRIQTQIVAEALATVIAHVRERSQDPDDRLGLLEACISGADPLGEDNGERLFAVADELAEASGGEGSA